MDDACVATSHVVSVLVHTGNSCTNWSKLVCIRHGRVGWMIELSGDNVVYLLQTCSNWFAHMDAMSSRLN